MRPKVIADDVRVLELIKAKKIVISEVDKAAFTATVKGLIDRVSGGQEMGRPHRPDRLMRSDLLRTRTLRSTAEAARERVRAGNCRLTAEHPA